MNAQDPMASTSSGNGGQYGARHNQDSDRLEREIQDQRNHINELVQALSGRLSPGEIFQRVIGPGKGGGEFARNLGQTIKSNPMPALITAAGMLWLYSSSHRSAGPGEAARSDGEEGPGMGHRVASKLGDVKHRAGGAARHAKDSIAQRSHQASEGLHRMLEESPTAVGAMAVAAGALLGALIPETSKENELLGEARDKLAEKAKNLGRQAADEVKSATREVTKPVEEGQPWTGGERDMGAAGTRDSGTMGAGTSTGTGGMPGGQDFGNPAGPPPNQSY